MKKTAVILIVYLMTCLTQAWAASDHKTLHVSSEAFAMGQRMLTEYTADGKDISPPLSFSGQPDATKCMAIICDDPDAPMGTWVHWVIYNLPPQLKELSGAVSRQSSLPDGSCQGKNSFGNIGYGGPSPPPGKPHHYFFKVYALDKQLDLKSGASKEELLKAMQGHILATGATMGTYNR